MVKKSEEDEIRVNDTQIEYITDRLSEILFTSFIFSEPMKEGDLDTSLYRTLGVGIVGARLTNINGKCEIEDSSCPLEDFVEDIYQVLMGSKKLRSRDIYPNPAYQTDDSSRNILDYIEFVRGKIIEFCNEKKHESHDGTIALCDLLDYIKKIPRFEVFNKEDFEKN